MLHTLLIIWTAIWYTLAALFFVTGWQVGWSMPLAKWFAISLFCATAGIVLFLVIYG